MARSLTVSLLSCILFFGLGEILSRIWVSSHGDALDVTRSVLQADSQLGWKTRSDLDAQFLNLPLFTDRHGWRIERVGFVSATSTSVVLLGPSSAFGWGVRAEDTYAMKLRESVSSSSVGVLNASVIGYSSDQGVRLFSMAEPELRARLIIFAYGVNDLDRSRFYFQSEKTDAQEFSKPEPERAVRLTNTVYSSALFEVLLKAAHRVLIAVVPHSAGRIDPVPTVRVPLEDFKKNMRALVQAAKLRGERVILLTTATNLPVYKYVPEASQLYLEAVRQWPTDKARALELFTRSVQLDPHENEPFYYLGDVTRARANEPYRISRDIPLYNAALKEIAVQEHVPIGDIDEWFKGHDRAALFVDPIHFSVEGNRLVALGLADIIRKNDLLHK